MQIVTIHVSVAKVGDQICQASCKELAPQGVHHLYGDGRDGDRYKCTTQSRVNLDLNTLLEEGAFVYLFLFLFETEFFSVALEFVLELSL